MVVVVGGYSTVQTHKDTLLDTTTVQYYCMCEMQYSIVLYSTVQID